MVFGIMVCSLEKHTTHRSAGTTKLRQGATTIPTRASNSPAFFSRGPSCPTPRRHEEPNFPPPSFSGPGKMEHDGAVAIVFARSFASRCSPTAVTGLRKLDVYFSLAERRTVH